MRGFGPGEAQTRIFRDLQSAETFIWLLAFWIFSQHNVFCHVYVGIHQLAKDFLCGRYLSQVVVSFVVSNLYWWRESCCRWIWCCLCGRKSFHLAAATFSHHWQHLAATGNPTHACHRQHCCSPTNCTAADQPPSVWLFLVSNLCCSVHAIDQEARHASPEQPGKCKASYTFASFEQYLKFQWICANTVMRLKHIWN